MSDILHNSNANQDDQQDSSEETGRSQIGQVFDRAQAGRGKGKSTR